MPRYKSGITWFDDDMFVGSEIYFPGNSSRWAIRRKIIEHEFCETEEDVKNAELMSEGRAVFVASNIDGSFHEEAIIKIRMQIPYRFTSSKPRAVRATQATDTLYSLTQNEIDALEILTESGCSCTPKLYSWYQKKQDWESWVPDGYIVYILMEKLPGIVVDSFFYDLDRTERDEFRQSFKKAWIECVSKGVHHGDPGLRNLLWDRTKQKCYMIDFEIWYETTSKTTWDDYQYLSWNLAQREDGDVDDMSTWEL